MKLAAPSPAALRVSTLPQSTKTGFALSPDKNRMAQLAGELGLLALRKLSFSGQIMAEGDTDWRLEAMLGATVVQPCAITLEPVTTRIDVPVVRLFQQDFADPEVTEIEMPEDDSVERLGQWIDPDGIMVEALALNLPLYPRKPDVVLGEVVVTEPGVAPLQDKDTKPFAGLAALKAQMDSDDPTD